MQLASTDGVTVALHDLGGRGDPLLIAHATGFCGQVYAPLAAELAGHFRVWALDFRAHGDSSAPVGRDADGSWPGLHWHKMADDFDAAVDELGGGPLAVFGHSLGGACALLAEARRPGLLRWAHVFEPIVFPSGFEGPHTPPLAEAAARRRRVFPARGDAMMRYASKPPLGLLRADCLHAYVTHGFRELPDGTVELKCSPEHEAAVFRGTGAITNDDITAVWVPVTVSTGTAEDTPANLAEGQVASLPNARLVRLAGLGHFGPLQDPVTVATHVLATARDAGA